MSIQSQLATGLKLGDLGESIPGLNADVVVENLVKKDEGMANYIKLIEEERKENIERGMTEEEANAQAEKDKKEAVETMKKNIKPAVEEDITKMKQEYKIAKEAIDSIPTEAQTVVALAAIPPSISTPPGTANPAYTLGIATQTKKTLLKSLSIATSALTTLILIASKIKFELPSVITGLVTALSAVSAAISIIPG
jgi:VIT1/CCC1 family predicted Fe2+/Mn2+ transporter